MVHSKKRAIIYKKRSSFNPISIGLFLIALGSALFFAAPFIYMLLMSLMKDANSILKYPPQFFSDKLYFVNFGDAWQYIDMGMKVLNTLFIMFFSMSLSLISSVLVAYGFARFTNRFSNVLFMILLSTMMIPWVVTMIPAYAEFEFLGWIGTRLPLIIPCIGGSAFNVFMIRSFMVSIPKELDEAAEIDGCGYFRILIKIILPQLKPVLATLFIFSFISSWSDFVGPSIYLRTTPENHTLAIAMQGFTSATGTTEWAYVMAASVIYSIPLVLLVIVFQKAFVRGVATTGIK